MTISAVLHAPQRASGALERAVRVGFVAKGALYLTIALFAVSTVFTGRARGGKDATETKDAMAAVLGAPFGKILLGLIAAGLAGYGVWRVFVGITDAEADGRDAKGVVLRVSDGVRGLFHLGLAYSAASLLLGHAGAKAGGAGDNEEKASKVALETPGGAWLLGGVAIGIAIYGGYQLYCAAAAKLGKHLDLPRQRSGLLVGICRFGIAARGIVFLSVALLFARAAYDRNPQEAGGVGDSLRELFALGTGPKLLIALGLAAYAVYQFVEARYRRIGW